MDRIVVVGASIAGLRAVEELRSSGFAGQVTVIGSEVHLPYDRPPLSKQLLSGAWSSAQVALTSASTDELGIEWRLETTATDLDLGLRRVVLSTGDPVEYDGLIIATGASARTLPGADALRGIFTLRTLDDCLAIRSAIDAGARRAVVVGAGFIGSEVASTCRTSGLEVTLVESLSVPLERALGPRFGGFVAKLHRDHGVDLRLRTGVEGFDGEDRIERVRLTTGVIDEVDICIVGIGVAPNVGWLRRSGLTIADGVVCDETCLAAPNVVAAGDVARWPNRLFGVQMRTEHWVNAAAMGAHAARTLLAGPDGGVPYAPVPWFWSDQYDRKIQLAGHVLPTDEIHFAEGSLSEPRFHALFGRGGRIVGALACNMPTSLARSMRAIESSTSWRDALAA